VIFVFATICLGLSCHDELVTSSEQDPNLTMQWCGMAAPPALSDWLANNRPGYRLAGWRCQLGKRATAA
jgi:hypothetical protein